MRGFIVLACIVRYCPMNFWNTFAAKHPAAAKWVREGGLLVIVSNLITVFKYLLLQFLPKAFASLPVVDFGWPGIDITLFGETFKWNILGYDAAHGGLPYFCAYMIAMVIGECINFPIQRNFVFRSKGNIANQVGWYLLAFCIITCIVNSINCIWVAVAGLLVPDFIYNIGTTVLNSGISMVIFFFVNKVIFPEGEQAKQSSTGARVVFPVFARRTVHMGSEQPGKAAGRRKSKTRADGLIGRAEKVF